MCVWKASESNGKSLFEVVLSFVVLFLQLEYKTYIVEVWDFAVIVNGLWFISDF
jgi:hypothetical protein